MRRFLISFLALFLILAGGVYFIALPQAKEEIIRTLNKTGFKNITVEGTYLTLSGFEIREIIGDGINIKNMSTLLYWPAYIIDKKIDSILIDELKLRGDQNLKDKNFLSLIPEKIETFDFQNTPDFKIQNLIININSKIKIIGNLEKSPDKIIAAINANNDGLSFQSKWSFSSNNNDKRIHADIRDLSINKKYFTLNRANGWMTYETSEQRALNAQIEAGSGSLLNAPLNNINLLIGKDSEGQSLLFRSAASGFSDITLKTDIEWSDNFDINLFTTQLSFPSTTILDEYLSLNNISTNDDIRKLALGPTEIIFEYLPERRFAEGPYPLQLKALENKKERLSGTALIYPENYDIRGNLTGNKDIVSFLDRIIPFSHQKITEETIRLEGKLSD